MGMRPHIQSMAGHELARSHLIKENERADHLSLAGWQRPAHLKPTNVVGAGHCGSVPSLRSMDICPRDACACDLTRGRRHSPITLLELLRARLAPARATPSYASKRSRLSGSERHAASSLARWLHRRRSLRRGRLPIPDAAAALR